MANLTKFTVRIGADFGRETRIEPERYQTVTSKSYINKNQNIVATHSKLQL